MMTEVTDAMVEAADTVFWEGYDDARSVHEGDRMRRAIRSALSAAPGPRLPIAIEALEIIAKPMVSEAEVEAALLAWYNFQTLEALFGAPEDVDENRQNFEAGARKDMRAALEAAAKVREEQQRRARRSWES
jgi:hypothetical protein